MLFEFICERGFKARGDEIICENLIDGVGLDGSVMEEFRVGRVKIPFGDFCSEIGCLR